MKKKTAIFYLILSLGSLSNLAPSWGRTDIPRPALGPYVYYTSPHTAVIAWETESLMPSVLSFGEAEQPAKKIQDQTPKKNHRMTLNSLRLGADYRYQIHLQKDGKEILCETHTLETTFNYTAPPIPQNLSLFPEDDATEHYGRMAKDILETTGITKGYCLVLGFGEGRLALELAKRSELIIVGVDEDANQVAKARKKLSDAKIYGPRITVRHVPFLSKLPFTAHFANLIVSESFMLDAIFPAPAEEVHRVLRPDGGALAFVIKPTSSKVPQMPFEKWGAPFFSDWDIPVDKAHIQAFARRGPLEGAGEWTHQYGDPGNASFGGEEMAQAKQTSDFQVQWLGRPGADFGLDRNPRMPAPLSANGRLFHQGMNRIIAVDAYNGAYLWLLEIPDLRRVNMPRDASNWCADADHLYVAIRDKCWVLDAETGRRIATLSTASTPNPSAHEWGYIASSGNKVFGSSVKKESIYTEFWDKAAWYDKPDSPGAKKICSLDLFALDKDSGATAWTYQNGLILNTTISIGGGRAYFVESRHPEPKTEGTSRIQSKKIWLDQFLVALDANTGEKIWEQPIDTEDGTVVFYMAYSEGNLLILSSTEGNYHLYDYEASDGMCKWQKSHKWTSNNHSGHMQHPAIVGGIVYQEPIGYDLETGDIRTTKMGRHEGCATYAAAGGSLFYRGKDRRVSMWDIGSEKVSSWYNLRPSCWLSVIPSGGMLLAPEGGGGCSCGNWIETSLGFLPSQLDRFGAVGEGR